MTDTKHCNYLTTNRGNDTLEFFAGIQDTYTQHVKDFIKWADGREVDFASIRDYFIYLNQDSGFAAGTIRIKRQAIKKRLRQMAYKMSMEDRLKVNDFLDVMDHTGETSAPKLASTKVPAYKYLTKPEVTELLKKAASKRQKCFINFLWYTGCRVGEMAGIKLSDVEESGGVYYATVRGKGNKFRTVPVIKKLYEAIRDAFRGSTYLFETSKGNPYPRSHISDEIRTLGKRILNRKISAHTLRHSYATHKIKKGVPISYVSRALGHASISVTADMYDHGEMEPTDFEEDYIDMDIRGRE